MDALLGAAALGDIGKHFPDNDKSYKDISSIILLKEVKLILAEASYMPYNVDVCIAAQEPKLSPYIEAMRKIFQKRLKLVPIWCPLRLQLPKNWALWEGWRAYVRMPMSAICC